MNTTPGTTLDHLAASLALRQHQAERALLRTFDALAAAEQAGQFTAATDAAARAHWQALQAYRALMPPVRDLTPAEVAAQLAAEDGD